MKRRFDAAAADLPVIAVVPELTAALDRGRAAVLQAPPGAGKTTVVPLLLIRAAWMAGQRILMMEPRRLAARMAARRMAALLGEAVGQTVGYRVRLERRIGPQTRIEVVTEGVLTGLLQQDPALEGVGLVIFDEFHERHLESDLGLALCREIQQVFNRDLRLLVMSATIATEPVAALLGDAAVIRASGRQFAVETRYLPPDRRQPLEQVVAAAVARAAAETDGSMLVFLPGALEIRRTAMRIGRLGLGPQWIVAPLFGQLSRREQDLAVAPAPAGRRKIVLASAIAETSLTIEGIRVVVDSGLARRPRFDVASGMTRLVTVPVTRDAADQRRGRAGRTAPGRCYRLWSEAEHAALAPRQRAEILDVDLAGMALELARWGVSDPGQLAWLDPPPDAAFGEARRLIARLGALESDGRISTHGRAMARLPVHPRLAHMLLCARQSGKGWAACILAAVLSERDPLRSMPGASDIDLRRRVDLVAGGQRPDAGTADPGWHLQRLARLLARRLGTAPAGALDERLGPLLAWAYPDRIAQRRVGARGRFLLANGREAVCEGHDPLAGAPWLVIAEMDGERRQARIFLAAAYDARSLEDQFGADFRSCDEVVWEAARQAVAARRTVRFGALVVRGEPLAAPAADQVAAAMLAGIRAAGLDCLPWTRDLRAWQQRVVFVRRVMPEMDWPDVSDPALAADLDRCLGPFLNGVRSLSALGRIDLAGALRSLLNGEQRRWLDQLAPTHLTVPSAARLPLDYAGEVPVLAARIQQMFGCRQTPAVADGRQPVLLHLLSPAGRPAQITQDLAGFWTHSYPAVRKALRGRYPKHPWPEDPLAAPATNRAKPHK